MDATGSILPIFNEVMCLDFHLMLFFLSIREFCMDVLYKELSGKI